MHEMPVRGKRARGSGHLQDRATSLDFSEGQHIMRAWRGGAQSSNVTKREGAYQILSKQGRVEIRERAV